MHATNLTQNSVSILQIINGEYFRKSYINSENGRTKLIQDCPSEITNEVFKMWGGSPTVEDITAPEPTPVQPDPRDIAIAQLMRDVAELKAKGEMTNV